jgi:glycosyltransferase involved in cell wall biosynthesis
LKQVQVLLATFNGEEFLSEFLESLTSQNEVQIQLLVSDDGSTDQTMTILKQFQKLHSSTRIFHGPRKGPKDNFFFLLRQANAEFVAFADQDDFWMPNHLLDSIDRLITKDVPALTFSPVIEFSLNSKDQVWPRKFYVTSREGMYIFQNPARGCTQVFNRKLLEIALKTPHEKALMHDFWLINLSTQVGMTIFSDKPEIYYRIHDNNYTLGRQSPRKRFSFSFLINHVAKCISQWREISDSNIRLNQSNNFMLNDLDLPITKYVTKIMFVWPPLRIDKYENILIKLTLILNRHQIKKILHLME